VWSYNERQHILLVGVPVEEFKLGVIIRDNISYWWVSLLKNTNVEL
jgi:hypothetical protein